MNEHIAKCVSYICSTFIICFIVFTVKSCAVEKIKANHEYYKAEEEEKDNG